MKQQAWTPDAWREACKHLRDRICNPYNPTPTRLIPDDILAYKNHFDVGVVEFGNTMARDFLMSVIIKDEYDMVSVWMGCPLNQNPHFKLIVKMLQLNCTYHDDMFGRRIVLQQLLQTNFECLFPNDTSRTAHWLKDSVSFDDEVFKIEFALQMAKLNYK